MEFREYATNVKKVLAVDEKMISEQDPIDDVLVRYEITVNRIKDADVCTGAAQRLLHYNYPDRVEGVNGPLNTELNREDPYKLHIIGNGSACIPVDIIASAITIECEDFIEDLAQLLDKAAAFRVLELNNTPIVEKIFDLKELAVFKFTGNIESPDVPAICEQLKRLPCLLEAEFDNCTVVDIKEVFTSYVSPVGSKVKYTLHDVNGHKFILSREKNIVKVEIEVAPGMKIANTIESVLKDCSVNIFLGVTIDADDNATNNLSDTLPTFQSFGRLVQQFEWINFGEDVLKSIKAAANQGWFSEYMPNLVGLYSPVHLRADENDSQVTAFNAVESDLRQLTWSPELREIGLIVIDPTEECDPSHSFVVNGMNCVTSYLHFSNEEADADGFIDHEQHLRSKTEKKAFAHSKKCSAPEN